MRTPSSDPRTAISHHASGFGAAPTPWLTNSDAFHRSGDRLIDAWQTALAAGNAHEVDRLVRRSRAVTAAQRRLSPDERLLG